MLNFTYSNPTTIVFGRDQLQQLNQLVPGQARVLITYGGGSAVRNGVIDRIKAELAKSSREIFVFGGIGANPEFSVLMQAIAKVREDKIDFLLAVGGGSVMDGTKFIALAAYADEFMGKEEALLSFGFKPVPVPAAIPVGTVVTLPATGSEMNGFAVISNGTDKLPVFSALAYPEFSILDPALTFTLPERQIANGVVDTFVHTVEQYVTYPVDARVQDRWAEGILQTLIEIGGTTRAQPEDYDARANLMWAATAALNGLIGSGVPQDWSVHMIGHELTALFGIDHARTLAVVLPATWKVRRTQKRAKLLQYAERVWNISAGNEEERIDAAIATTEAFFHSLGVPTRLAAYNLGEADIKTVIDSLVKHGMTALSESGDLTPEVARKILLAAL